MFKIPVVKFLPVVDLQTGQHLMLPATTPRSWRQWLSSQGYDLDSPHPFEELCDAEIYYNPSLDVSALKIRKTNLHLQDACLYVNIPSFAGMQRLLKAESDRREEIRSKTVLLEPLNPLDIPPATYPPDAKRTRHFWLLSHPALDSLPEYPDPQIQPPIIHFQSVVMEENDLFNESRSYLILTDDHEPYLTEHWASRGWQLYNRGRLIEIALGLWQVEGEETCYFYLDG